MSSTITIRDATVADVAGIARVHVESWRTTYAGILSGDYLAGLSPDVRWPMRKAMFGDPQFGKTKFTIVAEHDGQIVGFADGGPVRTAGEFDGEIFALYLLAQHQGRGLGRRVLRELAVRLMAAGYCSAIVGVLAANPACGFYERLGARYIHSEEVTIAGTVLEVRFYTWSNLESLCEK